MRDDGYSWLTAALIWLVFFQNLPSTLHGLQAAESFGSANLVDRAAKILMIAASCYLIGVRWSLARNLFRILNPGLVVFAVLAPLSIVWSIDRPATLLRFVSLAAVLLYCFASSLTSWHPRRLQQIAVPPVMLILVASLLLGAVAPDLVTEIGETIQLKGAWHGITHTKNEFGILSGFGVIFCSHRLITREGRKVLALTGSAVAFLCLILSKSNTSLFATGLALISMYMLVRVPLIKQRYSTHLVICIGTLVLIYELAIQHLIPGVDVLLAPVTGLTGKDTTFSARTVIWGVVKDHIRLSPWLGTGYGAYWVGALPSSPSYIFLSVMSLYPTESHNGYLEVVNDLGMAGLACVVIFIVWFMRQGLQLMRTDPNQAALYLGLLFHEMAINMSESEWFARSNSFAILALASVSLSRALLDDRLRGNPGFRPRDRLTRGR